MTLVTNSFESGSSSTTITTGNSGGSGSTAFDVVNIGSGAGVTFDNAHAAHGTLSGSITTGASSVTAYVAWTTTVGNLTQAWYRVYLYMSALPASDTSILRFNNSSGQTCSTTQVASSGVIRLQNSTPATVVSSSGASGTVPTAQWFRLEGYVTGDASAGAVECKIFKTADSVTADQTISAASINTRGALGQYLFGTPFAKANFAAWLDDLGLSDGGYIGPAGSLPRLPLVVGQAVQVAASGF